MRKRKSLWFRVVSLGILCLVAASAGTMGWALGAEGDQAPAAWRGILGMAGIAAAGSGLYALAVRWALRPLTAFLAARCPVDEDATPADEVSRLEALFDQQAQALQASRQEARQFAADAARAVEGPAAAILRALDGAEDTQAREAAWQQAERLLGIAGDMRMLDASHAPEEEERFLLSEMLTEILPGLQELLAEKEVALQLAGETVLVGHRAQLTRAFANLLDNAVRYNVPGGRVYVTGTKAGVRIADTGAGVETAHLPSLCTPFFQDEKKAQAAGAENMRNGMGLAVSRHVFAEHGMRVSITSDSGTTVSVYLAGGNE